MQRWRCALRSGMTVFLSTILIGNNIVNILASSLATVFFTHWLGENGVSVSTVVTTILVLIFRRNLSEKFGERISR